MTDRPLLNHVASSNDPGIYSAELDWFFNCYDYECGLRSVGMAGVDLLFEKTGKLRSVDETANPTVNLTGGRQGASGSKDPWATTHHLATFRKGRRIWGRLVALPYRVQCGLRYYYEPRRFAPAGESWGTQPLGEAEIRALHEYWNNWIGLQVS